MKIEKDISDLKDFIKGIPKEIGECLDKIGSESVELQKEKSNYKNHTWNLRNAPGYSVIVNGKEVTRNIPTDGEHGEAEAKTDVILNKADKSGTGIVFADGMPYASFVSSNGYDVLDTTLLHADKRLQEESE